MRDGTWYLRQRRYIMSSLLRTLYTGVTDNLERRLLEHQVGKTRLIHRSL
jgi:predicted GIY-YIG superfamily endonuclease